MFILACWLVLFAAHCAVPPVAAADIAFIYDALGRLVAVVDSASASNEVAIFRYDSVGNLLAVERQSAAIVSIIEFAPSSGPVGTTVTIYGTGFSATASENTVAFNGTAAAPVISATPTQIVTTVPVGATTGPITLAAPGGSATSSTPFSVGGLGAPTITGFTPVVGTPGTAVSVAGTNFEVTPAYNKIRFNNVAYAVTGAATATALSTEVPTGTGSGRLSVTTPGGQAVSAADFFVPPSPYTAADVEVTGRMAITGAGQGVSISTPGKIALIVFDAFAGQRATLAMTNVTMAGTALVSVNNPNGTRLTYIGVGPSGANLNLTLPSAGTYTIVVDPGGTDTGSLTLAFSTPDLVATELTSPASAATQQTVSVTWSVTNQGASTQGSWSDYLYLSTDSICCVGDTFLTLANRSALTAGSSYTETKTFTVPNVPAGNYSLIVRTDHAGSIFEADETNNQRVVPITITTPDLTPTELTAPASAAVQQSIAMSWTVANQGTGATQASWVDWVYLSSDQTCCTGDTALALLSKSGIAAGASYTETRTISVPNVAAGNYYLILRTDLSNGLYEASETNNERIVPITITKADFAPTALTAPATVVTQQSIAVSWTVANQGTGPPQMNWFDYLYLSADTVCCTGDTLLVAPLNTTPVAAGATYTKTPTVTVPSVPAGSYTLILRVDHLGGVFEVDETNNERQLAVTITTPDLAPTTLEAPSAAQAGQSISLSWTVTNQGSGATQPSWFDAVYLSSDQACCAGDIILTAPTRPSALTPGASYTQSRTVTIPGTVAAGSYYLILRIDSGGWVYEANETNNALVVPITISAP